MAGILVFEGCAKPGDLERIMATQTIYVKSIRLIPGLPNYLAPNAIFKWLVYNPGVRQIQDRAYRIMYKHFSNLYPAMNLEMLFGRLEVVQPETVSFEQLFPGSVYDDIIFYSWVNLGVSTSYTFNAVNFIVPPGAIVVFNRTTPFSGADGLFYPGAAVHSVRLYITWRITRETATMNAPFPTGIAPYTPEQLAMFKPTLLVKPIVQPVIQQPVAQLVISIPVSPGRKRPNNDNAGQSKRAATETTEMCIMCTGVRSGEHVEGLTKALGTLMQVFFPGNEMYKPADKYVSQIRITDYRDRFTFPFFSDMDVDARKTYIESKQFHDSKYGRESLNMPDTEIILLSVGGEKITDTDDPDRYSELMDGRRHPISEFYKLIPGGLKNNGSLVLHGHYWKLRGIRPVRNTDLFVKLVAGLTTNLGAGNVGIVQKAVPGFETHLIHRGYQCSLTMPGNPPATAVLEIVDARRPFSLVNWKRLQDYEPTLTITELQFNAIKSELDWFTPSLHKSLIQKLIRTRCVDVRMHSGTYPASAVLFVSFVMLVTDPGSFVPNISRFVRGPEAAFKRAGVAMAEDSFTSASMLVITLAAALAAQEHPEFVPSEQLVAAVVAGLIVSQGCAYAWDYDSTELVARKITLTTPNKESNKSFVLPYYLLTTLRSFKTDIELMWCISWYPDRKVKNCETREPLPIMPIEYCLDQHSLPTIAHFFPPENRTFKVLFADIFKTGTGQNARKEAIKEMPRNIATAQRLLWLSKTSTPVELASVGSVLIRYVLHGSWIAGLLGKIVVFTAAKTEYNVFVNPDNGAFSVIRPATRDRAVALLSDEEKALAIAGANKLLAAGIKVSSSLLGINGIVTKVGNDFFLDKHLWNTYRKGELVVAVVPAFNYPHKIMIADNDQFVAYCEHVFTHKCSKLAVIPDYMTVLGQILDSVPAGVLPRIAMYVRPIKRVIELFRISRDGTGTYLAVSWRDSYVFRMLIYICAIAPGIVHVDRTLKFHISDFRVWNLIRTAILDRLSSVVATTWDTVFYDKRDLFDYQTTAIDKIKTRFTNNQRGNLIWITVGLGKTLIISTVIGWLIQQGRENAPLKCTHMPRYCIYALPPSALKSVKRELEAGGLPVNIVTLNSKTLQTNPFKPFCINLIVHDQLRLGITSSPVDLSQCLFILDEMHYALNNTLRTSAALEIAKLSWNFIGLTGTLIKDASSDGLIEWVSQIVEFEVTESNLWVAVSALVSQHIKLNFPCRRLFKEIEMNKTEKDEYIKHVTPSFGGTAVRSNFHAAVNVCFEVIQRGIIETTLRLFLDKQPTTTRRPIFVVARNVQMQTAISAALQLEKPGLRVLCIGPHNPIVLTPADPITYDVVITTIHFSTGYTFTQANIMVTAIYFSNQATRDQLDGRIMRVGQTDDGVTIYILHTGLLTYTKDHYEDARSFKESMEALSDDAVIHIK